MLFRFRLTTNNFLNAAITSISLALVSYILNKVGLTNISVPIQIIIYIILIKFLFKNRILHASLIGIVSYILYGVIQTILLFVLDHYNIMKFSEVVPFAFKAYILQLFSFIIVLIISIRLRKTNAGYSFVPEETFVDKKIKYSNKLFILCLSLTAIVVTGSFYEFRQSSILYTFIAFLTVISLSCIILLYISLKRDKEEAEV
jgi:hypothetical protein